MDNGDMLIDSIEYVPFQFKKEITIQGVNGAPNQKREQTLTDLSLEEKIRYSCDIKATNIILLGLPNDAKEVREMKQRHPDQLALLANNYNPPPPYSKFVVPSFLLTDDPITSLNKAMMFLNTAMNSKFPPTNNQLKTSSNPRTQATVQDGRVTVQNIQGRQSQGYGVNTGNIQAILEDIEDCDDLQQHTASNFKTNHVDAYNSNCDDEATASSIFMATLSLAGSINGDTVGPTYDSDILSEVPHYDTYHENDVINSAIQETEYNEPIVSNNDTYDELTSDSNVISYVDYMVTIENDAVNILILLHKIILQ
ncbi:hypothetical protein Tco_1438134 [Tanacetum coccineum]